MPIYGTGFVPAAGSITNELNAVTRRAFIPKLVVQLYSSAPLLNVAMRNAQRAKGGLSQITVPVQGNPFVAFNWAGYAGTFPQPSVTPAVNQAQWNLSVGTVPISLLGMESLMQTTETIIPLVKARMADAKTVAVQALSTAFFGSNATDQTAMNGLLDAYDDGTTVATYGGINRTTSTYWKSTKITTSVTPTRISMIKLIMQITKAAGGEAPDMIVMSMGDWTTLMTDFMSLEQFQTRPTSRYGKDDAVNAGFRCIMLGDTPIMADPFCPTGKAFIINTKYLGLYVSEDANFAWSGYHSLIPNNQLANVGVVVVAMSLVNTKPISGAQLATVAGAAF